MNARQEKVSDQKLLQQSASGNQDAFGELYERYLEQIYRYVYYRVMDVHEAEDLTEAVFLRAWERLQSKQARKEVENFSAWIYRIAHNLVIDHHRKKTPEPLDTDSSAEYSQALTPGAEIEVQQRLDQQSLAAALEELDEPMQRVVILRFLNHLSHAEVAAVLGLSEGNVRVLQFRALKRLKVLLSED